MDLVGGAALGKVAKVAGDATRGVIRALLLPTAKVYGEHWAEQAKERLAQEKETKRESNTRAQVERAAERMKEGATPDPSLVENWLSAVGNVDPADVELSAAWQGAFDAIAQGNPFRQRLLEILPKMSADEIMAFMAEGRRPSNLCEYSKRFEELGLWRHRPLNFWLALACVQGLSLIFSAGYFLARGPQSGDWLKPYLSTAILSGIGFTILSTTLLYLLHSRYTLSALGRQLLDYSSRRLADAPSASRNAEEGETAG